jgi:hypothetical protein
LYRRFGAADSSSSDEEDFDPVAFLREAQDARKASSTRGRVGPCRGYYCYYYYYYGEEEEEEEEERYYKFICGCTGGSGGRVQQPNNPKGKR